MLRTTRHDTRPQRDAVTKGSNENESLPELKPRVRPLARCDSLRRLNQYRRVGSTEHTYKPTELKGARDSATTEALAN